MPGLTPYPLDRVSISEAVNSKTAPFVDASIQAWYDEKETAVSELVYSPLRQLEPY